MWAGDELIQTKKTTRPPYIDSRVWSDSISAGMRKAIAEEYKLPRPVIDAARNAHGISEFLDPDDKEGVGVIKAARNKLALPPALAMPTLRVYDERQYAPPFSPFNPRLKSDRLGRSNTLVSAGIPHSNTRVSAAFVFAVIIKTLTTRHPKKNTCKQKMSL